MNKIDYAPAIPVTLDNAVKMTSLIDERR